MAAGFALVVWDDEGEVRSVVHLGHRNPFSSVLLPDMIRDQVRQSLPESEL